MRHYFVRKIGLSGTSMADAEIPNIHLYDRIFRDEYVQMLQEGVSSWWKISGW